VADPFPLFLSPFLILALRTLPNPRPLPFQEISRRSPAPGSVRAVAENVRLRLRERPGASPARPRRLGHPHQGPSQLPDTTVASRPPHGEPQPPHGEPSSDPVVIVQHSEKASSIASCSTIFKAYFFSLSLVKCGNNPQLGRPGSDPSDLLTAAHYIFFVIVFSFE
jgi:hypothetical protein